MALYRLRLAAAMLGGLFLAGCNGSSEEAGSKDGVNPEVATQCSGGTFSDGQCKPDTRVIAEPEVVCKDGTVVDGACVPDKLAIKETACEQGEIVDGECVPNLKSSTGLTSLSSRGSRGLSYFVDTEAGLRKYYLRSDKPGRWDATKTKRHGGVRVVTEDADRPVTRTSSPLFDGLFALAIQEAGEMTVTGVSDDAYNQKQPIPCGGTVGCYKTGVKWSYVWTRDTAYAIDLGLAQINPQVARNGLLFKTSQRRAGFGTQGPEGTEIIQDTGSGGSWPVSTDRVSWARGAWEVLKYLDGDERTQFLNEAYTAIRNTIEKDRSAVYDWRDGLYRGESSFTDWRQQTYPAYAARDLTHIAMSKVLSTNVGFYKILDVAAKMATELKRDDEAKKYEEWASTLKVAINKELWLADYGLYSMMKPTKHDPRPVRRFELLGETLAILDGVADKTATTQILANYPHAPAGAPVVWPQVRDVPIIYENASERQSRQVYHNRAIWPFVSSYLVKAAAKGGNSAVVNKNFMMLMTGAALNLSNMENFEFVTLSPNDPHINSEAQLWSVGGYIGVVLDTIFGRDVEMDAGIRFRPFITKRIHGDVFGGERELTLSNLDYRGRKINVKVKLPAKGLSSDGAYQVSTASLNGATIDPEGFTPAASLKADEPNLFEIGLIDRQSDADRITTVSADTDLYGPDLAEDILLDRVAGVPTLQFGPEALAGGAVNIYRDGELVYSGTPNIAASGRPVGWMRWQDEAGRDIVDHIPCYTVERQYASGLRNVSQRSEPLCDTGAVGAGQPARSQSILPASQQDISLAINTSANARFVLEHGAYHWADWGFPGAELTFTFTPPASGTYTFRVAYGNAHNAIDTGITATVKEVEISDNAGNVVSREVAVMPHRQNWGAWGESNIMEAKLEAKTYSVKLKDVYNMSYLASNALYGGNGGVNPINRANIRGLAFWRKYD